MGIGVSVFLMAVGAILTFGITADASGFNIDTIGWILMGVGLLGLLISSLFFASWAPYGRSEVREREVVDRDRAHTH